MEMPHPEKTWKKDHQNIGKKNPASCTLCHQEKDFCNNCHHDPPVKEQPWIPQHFKVVKDSGADPCFSCHDPTYCSHCHVRKLGEYK